MRYNSDVRMNCTAFLFMTVIMKVDETYEGRKIDRNKETAYYSVFIHITGIYYSHVCCHRTGFEYSGHVNV